MKKYVYLILFILMVASVAATNTDFSQRYMQSRAEWSYTGNVYTFNSYLLSSTAPDTGMNYGLGTWGFCSVTLGGSEFRSIPLSISDSESEYDHRSVVVTYETSIKQYASDCSVVDTYNMPSDRYILTKMGSIRNHRDGENYYDPNFAVVNYDNSTNETYMTIYTLDRENSTFTQEADVLIANAKYTDSEDWYGVAGGCASNVYVSCEDNERSFAAYNNHTNKMYLVTHASGVWSFDAEISIVPSQDNEISHANDLYFYDYDDDLNNEYIYLTSYAVNVGGVGTEGFYVLNNMVQPLTSSPYYYKYTELVSPLIDQVSAAYNVKTHDISRLFVCQIGDVDGEMEVCFNTDRSIVQHSGFISNDFTSVNVDIAAASNDNVTLPNPFTYDADADASFESDLWHGCFPYDSNTYKCYDDSGTLVSYFDSNIAFNVAANTQGLRAFVTELDGNTSAPEILYSNGSVETIVWNGTNTPLTPWTNTFDLTYYGDMYVQDISNDEKNEFVYIDDTFLRIYTNDDTPYTFENFTSANTTAFPSTNETTSSSDYYTTGSGDTGAEFVDFLNTPSVFKLVIAIGMIIGIIIMAASVIKSAIVLLLIGILATVLVSFLGLISSGVLVLIIVASVILLILGVTIFKPSGND